MMSFPTSSIIPAEVKNINGSSINPFPSIKSIIKIPKIIIVIKPIRCAILSILPLIKTAINTAKRIESLTRDLSDTILISETIYEKVKDLFSTKLWGEASLKGKEKKILVYQLI